MESATEVNQDHYSAQSLAKVVHGPRRSDAIQFLRGISPASARWRYCTEHSAQLDPAGYQAMKVGPLQGCRADAFRSYLSGDRLCHWHRAARSKYWPAHHESISLITRSTDHHSERKALQAAQDYLTLTAWPTSNARRVLRSGDRFPYRSFRQVR